MITGVHTSLLAGNLRATLLEHRRRFPDFDSHLVDRARVQLISDLISPAIDIAFVAEPNPIGLERTRCPRCPENHPFRAHNVVHWGELRIETLLLPRHGAGSEFYKLLISKLGSTDACLGLRDDVALDRLLTLVGAGWGALLALGGATAAAYPGVSFRQAHHAGLLPVG
ncbi:hypothetical protein I6F14_09295 [Bradyrhizobium sp. IC3069]|uniref:hypothetical protein n=1 Tax=unclassified Bradyrhizobium TaxID=2631580 RepID=UPI001CD39E69|nr:MULTISPECIES: hypothetical protein [unclassified Bradyrhizobium]MCA1360984.1 hypothetical protein [Bradyrhizobium sp. IC4059]MCA1411396.1 hypothetical protein [Bradyrhizobium sp. NBAIM20]MCA1460743.1 hypothetical protein [Bradyrhizobium sp. NBAIM18]MCA1518214.1 hypothetical protein [Bradyrhizobium sp. IC3069]